MTPLLARIRGRVVDHQIPHPVHIIASPYCNSAPEVGALLQKWQIGKRVMPEDLQMMARFRETISEANFSVQKHLSASVYLKRHGDRVRQILSGLTPRVAPYDIFASAPFGQTYLHPYVRKAVAPQARFIWLARNKDRWLEDVQKFEQANPRMFPEAIQWDENPEARGELLKTRWRKERRKFLRLARDFPDDCIEIRYDKADAHDKIAAFYGITPP